MYSGSRRAWSVGRRHFATLKKIPNFSDPQASLKGKTTPQLLRALVVFSLCQIRPLIVVSEQLIRFSYAVLREPITDALMKSTFYGHFCAGEDTEGIMPTVRQLEANGVGSIFDYAAEADVVNEPKMVGQLLSHPITSGTRVQTYEYEGEKKCDEHVNTFKVCISSARSSSSPTSTCFAAIKMTALGNPKLLRKVSHALEELYLLYVDRINAKKKVNLSRADFKEAYDSVFKSNERENSDELFDKLDLDRDGEIDVVDWMHNIPIEGVYSLLTSRCIDNQGRLSRSVLTDEEVVLCANMMQRLHSIVDEAEKHGVRVMIDAEQSYFQPCIDYIATRLMAQYNKPTSYPVVFSTYQMYLKDAERRLHNDVLRAERYNYTFAAKLVRGAYVVGESKHALQNNLPSSPVHDCIEDTHTSYNNGVRHVIDKITQQHRMREQNLPTNRIEVMFATHNQKSVELAVDLIVKNNLPPATCGVYFGQLLGMSDHLTYTLGSNDYKAYKYVPFGKVREVLPYLIRRGVENADAMGGAKFEMKIIVKELLRRVFKSEAKAAKG